MDVFWAAFGGGAAGSAFTFLALITQEWLRRKANTPYVDVKISLGFLVFLGEGLSDFCFYWIIRNKRPFHIIISGYGLVLRNPKEVMDFPPSIVVGGINSPSTPYTLEAFNSVQFRLELDKLKESLRRDAINPKRIHRAWVDVASGERFTTRIPKKILKSFAN